MLYEPYRAARCLFPSVLKRHIVANGRHFKRRTLRSKKGVIFSLFYILLLPG